MPAGFGEDVSVGTAEPAGRADYDEWRGSVRGSAQEVVDGCTPGPSATSHAAAAATALDHRSGRARAAHGDLRRLPASGRRGPGGRGFATDGDLPLLAARGLPAPGARRPVDPAPRAGPVRDPYGCRDAVGLHRLSPGHRDAGGDERAPARGAAAAP